MRRPFQLNASSHSAQLQEDEWARIYSDSLDSHGCFAGGAAVQQAQAQIICEFK